MAWFTSFWEWLLGIFQQIIDLPYTIFDSMLSFIESAVLSIDLDFSAIGNIWSVVPPQFLYISSQLHLRDCFLLFFAIVLIRVGLNLVPSWGTRV